MRAFIGVPVDAAVALQLLALRDEVLRGIGASQPRAIPAANFHLTLAFLGSVEEEKVDVLEAILSTVANEFCTFPQVLTSIVSFPGPAGLIVAAEGALADDLGLVHKRLNERLLVSQFKPDSNKALRPHVSLGRLQFPVVPPVNTDCQIAVSVNSLVLYESLSRQGKTVYRPIRRAELR